ncbi:tetratricopeptide repeat protein [Sporocytophaga myxococcoides]|nr:tetratricopeptide repeat protein [Sporocytophaga myxococcoides]
MNARQDTIPPVVYNGSFEPQLTYLNSLIEDDPENPEYYFQRAKVFFDIHKYSDALKDINQAISLESNEELYYELLARIYQKMGKTSLALNSAHRAESYKNDDPELFLLLSRLYWELKDLGKAQQYLAKAKQLAPMHSEVFLLQGVFDSAKGDTTAAVKSFKVALAQDPENAKPFQELAKIYLARNKEDSAMYYVLEGRSINPNNPFFTYFEGVVLESKGLKTSSLRAFRKAIQMDSTFYPAYYRLGVDAFNSGSYTEAQNYFAPLTDKSEFSLNSNLYIAEILEKTGQGAKAVSYYENVKSEDTTNVKAKEALTRLYKLYPPVVRAPKIDSSAIKPGVKAPLTDTVKSGVKAPKVETKKDTAKVKKPKPIVPQDTTRIKKNIPPIRKTDSINNIAPERKDSLK